MSKSTPSSREIDLCVPVFVFVVVVAVGVVKRISHDAALGTKTGARLTPRSKWTMKGIDDLKMSMSIEQPGALTELMEAVGVRVIKRGARGDVEGIGFGSVGGV